MELWLIFLRVLAEAGYIAIFVFNRCDQQTAADISQFLLYLRSSLYHFL